MTFSHSTFSHLSLSQLQLSQLLLLSSSNLPIGSYSYSQGIESAIDEKLIIDEASALLFLNHYQQQVLIESDLLLFAAIMQLLLEENHHAADNLAEFYQASRDSFEFAQESLQLAQAFSAWIGAVLKLDIPPTWAQQGYLPLLARLCQHWQLPIAQALQMYGFSQMENLTLAVVKTLPLGQMAGQRVIWQLQQQLAQQVEGIAHTVAVRLQPFFVSDNGAKSPPVRLLALLDCLQLSTAQPHLSHLSCIHEQQYSRLFRS